METYMSIDDTIKDLKELIEYSQFVSGIKKKDINKLKKCIKKLENEEYEDVIPSSLLEDGEIC